MPTEVGTAVHLEHVKVNIDDMLPSERTHWRYHGSLTTPPCSEGVQWFLMKSPIRLDAEQIQQFRSEFTGNNRPTQAIHGREDQTAKSRPRRREKTIRIRRAVTDATCSLFIPAAQV